MMVRRISAIAEAAWACAAAGLSRQTGQRTFDSDDREARAGDAAFGRAGRGRHAAFLVAEAESVPGPILEIGNTNSRYRFAIGAKGFLNAWSGAAPAHHTAIGVGHLSGALRKLGALLDIETIQIC